MVMRTAGIEPTLTEPHSAVLTIDTTSSLTQYTQARLLISHQFRVVARCGNGSHLQNYTSALGIETLDPKCRTGDESLFRTAPY